MNEICNLVGSDYNEVRELWLLDPRINKMHTSVFSGNDRPFGGKCLPKDTSALVSVAKENGYDANFLAETELVYTDGGILAEFSWSLVVLPFVAALLITFFGRLIVLLVKDKKVISSTSSK